MEFKSDVLAIVSMGIVLVVVVLLIFFLQGFVGAEDSSFCNSSSDCANLSHKNCSGSWNCEDGYCNWKCEFEGECAEPSDCYGKPHIMCTGNWTFEHGGCSWECEVGTIGELQEGSLFIEHKKSISGEILSGKYSKTFLYGDDEYSFDEDDQTLIIHSDNNYQSAMAIYGYSETMEGAAGEGSESEISLIHSVPSNAGADKISRIWDNGKIAISFGQKAVTLSPGEEWESIAISEDVGAYDSGIIRLTITDKIINHGFINVEQEE